MIKSKFDILLILFMINVLLIIARKDNQNINTLHFIFYFLLKNLLFVNRFDYILLNTLLFVNRFDYVL